MPSDSWRCLIILPITSTISASPSVSRSAPLVAGSRIAALTSRSVETRCAWPAFIATLRSLLIVSRSTGVDPWSGPLLRATAFLPERKKLRYGPNANGGCVLIYYPQIRGHDPDASDFCRHLGRSQADRVACAGRWHGARRHGLRRGRPCGRRGLLQYGDDRLSGDSHRSVLCRADHYLHVSPYRQCRHQ